MYIDEDCDCDFCREAKKAYNKTEVATAGLFTIGSVCLAGPLCISGSMSTVSTDTSAVIGVAMNSAEAGDIVTIRMGDLQ